MATAFKSHFVGAVPVHTCTKAIITFITLQVFWGASDMILHQDDPNYETEVDTEILGGAVVAFVIITPLMLLAYAVEGTETIQRTSLDALFCITAAFTLIALGGEYVRILRIPSYVLHIACNWNVDNERTLYIYVNAHIPRSIRHVRCARTYFTDVCSYCDARAPATFRPELFTAAVAVTAKEKKICILQMTHGTLSRNRVCPVCRVCKRMGLLDT